MCDVTAAVAVGGMALAGAASAAQSRRSSSGPSQTTTQTPWQASHLNAGFDHARALFDEARVQSPWQGDLSVGMNDVQQRGINNTIARADNAQGGITQAIGQANGLIGQADNFTSNAGALASGGAGPANSTASGVLSGAATGGLSAPGAVTNRGLGALTGGVDAAAGLVQQAQGDPAMRALSTGGAFANDPVVQQQIDNAALDVTRNFNETTAPGLNARASAGGNLNSARAGIAEGLARRDVGESIGRIASQVRGNAFNTGVSAGMEGNAQNNALALGANQQQIGAGGALEGARQFDIGTQVGGANALGGLDTTNRALDVNTRLEANNQLGRGALSGFDAAGAAMDMADQNANRYIGAGGMIQAEQQRQAEEDQANYYRTYNYQRGLATDLLDSVQGNYGGVSQVQTNTGAGPGVIQGALGGAAAGMGLYSSYQRSRPSVGAGYSSTGRP